MQNHQASKNLNFKNLLADFLRIYNQVSKTINIHRYETVIKTVCVDPKHLQCYNPATVTYSLQSTSPHTTRERDTG